MLNKVSFNQFRKLIKSLKTTRKIYMAWEVPLIMQKLVNINNFRTTVPVQFCSIEIV